MASQFSASQMAKKVLVFIASLTVFAGCTQQTAEKSNVTVAQKDQIFSVRPQNFSHFIAIVKLKTPALLETAEGTVKNLKINSDQAAAINAEQEVLIADLGKISSEIKILFRYKLVLNGIALLAPVELKEKLKGSVNISFMEEAAAIGRPRLQNTQVLKKALQAARQAQRPWGPNSSVDFIEGGQAHEMGFRGQGMVF
ncbi:MAG: hypothetical protein ACK5WZ_03375 [Pseudobdellovibrionaceae bacterium]